MSLGERLIKLRKNKQLSQEDVAEKLNVTRQTISKWETDASTPDFDKIVPLCSLYGISSDELLTGKKEETPKNKEDNINTSKIKRAEGIGLGVFLYFLSVVWIMIGIPVLNLNPIVASAIFLLICGIATYKIIYTCIIYKKEERKEDEKNKKITKQIESILSILTLIIYLGVSFLTMAWHITWMIWLIYALVMEIVKLIISLKEKNHEE